jgi:Protein tyrosine and serine/threonine kinase
MVSDAGIPKLTNFGLFQVVDLIVGKTDSMTTNPAFSSIRWSAPETLLDGSPGDSRTEKSDVYALAITCIEVGNTVEYINVISSQLMIFSKLILLEEPYQGLSDEQVFKHVVIDGKILARPSRKVKYSPNDPFWHVLTICWSIRPHERPNIVAFRRKLAEFSNASVVAFRRKFAGFGNTSTRNDGTRKKWVRCPAWIGRLKRALRNQ